MPEGNREGERGNNNIKKIIKRKPSKSHGALFWRTCPSSPDKLKLTDFGSVGVGAYA
jgi:hypothetical protein